MPHLLLIFSQSDYLIQVFDTNSYTYMAKSQISWLLQKKNIHPGNPLELWPTWIHRLLDILYFADAKTYFCSVGLLYSQRGMDTLEDTANILQGKTNFQTESCLLVLDTFRKLRFLKTPCPAEPGYTLPLQTV